MLEATLEQLAPPSELQEAPSTEEAPPQEEALEPSSDLQEFLQSQGLAEAESQDEPSGDSTEDEDEAWIASLPEDQRERARTLVEAKRETQLQQEQAEQGRKQQVSQAQRQRYQNVQAALGQYLEQFTTGQREFTAEDAQRIRNTFNNYNNDILAILREEPETIQNETRSSFLAGLSQAAQTVLPASQGKAFKDKQFKSSADFLKEVISAARADYVSAKEQKAKVAEALLKYENELIKKGKLTGPAARGVGTNNVARVTGKRTPAEIIDDPDSSFEDKDEAFKSLYGISYPR